ncbi:MAG: COX15/CtaA family protein [Gammaproteobacteria bacterium]|nr:COX15/CtaA family protein [Gammaproteobacteria bacterium]
MENTITNRVVANWLLICCALVFAMVVLGGVTRLTGSGLSMVEWRPIMGAVPPLSAEEWQEKFEIYQLTPEFQKVNSDFDLGDFKGIFWLEYLHRLLGRLIGLVFVLPMLYFAATGYIRMRDLPKYLLMLALGGGQAFIGKLMVASGQVDAPQVSHYRLTAHLSAAFLVYALMLWTALSLLFPAARDAVRHALYRRTVGVFALVCIMIISGGFVAGLKAWKIYNTFPKMGDEWIPQGLTALSPLWRNAFDNMVTVQFNHRWLAVITFVTIVTYWFAARKADLPKRARPAANALLHTVSLQVILGISALVLAVPVVLGAAHQAVGLLLFTVMLYLVHALRRVEVSATASDRS